MLTSLRSSKIYSVSRCPMAAVAGGSLALLAMPALAGTPQAMTLVPDDAAVVVVIPNLGELLGDIDAINAMMGPMGKMEVTMGTSMLRGMPGIDLGGSAAVVLDFDGDFENEPDAVVMVPVSSFADLTRGLEPVDGIVEFPMGGDMIYFRDLGNGYAAMSNVGEIVSDFVPASKSMEEAQAMLGTAGSRVANDNDVMVYLNFDAVRPMLEESFAELEAQGDMVEMMGGAQAAQGFDTFVNLYKTAVKDGHAAVSGMSFDAGSGFAFDFGLQFREGSDSAAMFHNDGDSGSYFDRVPEMDFFFAQAFDLRGEGIQAMMSGYLEMIEKFDTTGMMSGMGFETMIKEFQGGAQVMGATNIMAMNGILANTVMYTEGVNADDAIGAMKGMYGSMGDMEMPGMGVSASFSEEASTVNGVEAYSHSMSFEIDPAMAGGGGFGAPDPAMMLQMMYGPSKGPAGYVAKAGKGMVVTFSQDGDLLARAYKAAAGGENTMMGNTGIAAAAAMLPENRVYEAYMGVEQLLNSAGPMMMMFGLIPEFEPLDGVTPIAFGATADGGGMMVRTVISLDTVNAIMDLVPADALGGGGGDDWDDEDDDSMDF